MVQITFTPEELASATNTREGKIKIGQYEYLPEQISHVLPVDFVPFKSVPQVLPRRIKGCEAITLDVDGEVAFKANKTYFSEEL